MKKITKWLLSTPARKPRNTARLGRPADYSQLEARYLLTSFVVNTTLDDPGGLADGLISLREAVVASNTDAPYGDAPAGSAIDQIFFHSSIANRTIVLGGSQLEVTSRIEFYGGDRNITIDGDGRSRVFEINTDHDVIISRLNLTGGFANIGGAVLVSSVDRLNIKASHFFDNEATGPGGGAIYSDGARLLAIDESTFNNNQATGDNGSGGAIHSGGGHLYMSRTTLQANRAYASGGALSITGGSFTAEAGVDFVNNDAGPVGYTDLGQGGAVYVHGQSILAQFFSGWMFFNYASQGGGVWNQGENLINFLRTDIEENHATGNAEGDAGGGIYNDGGQVRLLNVDLLANEAEGQRGRGGGIFSTGGGFVSVAGSRLKTNFATLSGGGIEIVDGIAHVDRTELGGTNPRDGNKAGNPDADNIGKGAGLHVSGPARVVFNEGWVRHNVASGEGGGLWNHVDATMLLRGTEIISNRAAGTDSGQGGGGIYNNGGSVFIRDAAIIANSATGRGGGAGGGVFSADGTLSIRDSTISRNQAVHSGGGVEVGNGYAKLSSTTLGGPFADEGNVAELFNSQGGGLHVHGQNGTRVVIEGGTVANNQAGLRGGGLYHQAGSTMVIRSGARITSNYTLSENSNGGGLYNAGGRLQIIDSLFAQNQSQNSGGALFNEDGRVTCANTDFLANQALARGGAILNKGNFRIEQSRVFDNVANINGGGIFTSIVGTTTEVDTEFGGNLPNDIWPPAG